MSSYIFKELYKEITLLIQIKTLWKSELDAFRVIVENIFFKFILFNNTITLNNSISIFLIIFFFFSLQFFFILFGFILFILFFSLLVNLFFFIIIPFIFRLKIYYNSSYQGVSLNQKKILNGLENTSKNIVLITFSGFNDNEDKIKDFTIPIMLAYYKIINYSLSSFRTAFTVILVLYLIIIFIFMLMLAFYIIDILSETYIISQNILFLYSMCSFFIYSYFVYIILSFSSLPYFYDNKIFRNNRNRYDRYFLCDFIINGQYIYYKEIYDGSNFLRKDKNYFMYILIGGIFWMYVPLMYDKIYNVNINVKAVESSVINKFIIKDKI